MFIVKQHLIWWYFVLNHVQVLHNLGLRKFLLAAVGPLGCMPNQIATGVAPPGKCITYINDMVEIFNKKLLSLVDQLNTNYSKSSAFVYGNTYGVFTDILNRPDDYGEKHYSSLITS